MTTTLLCAAFLLSSASAQDTTPAQALSSFAERLRSSDQEVIVRERVGEGWGNACVLPRERALQSVYRELAAENYRQSVEAGKGDEAKASVERMGQRQEQTFRDAKALKVDPKGLTPVECPLPCCVVVRLRCECACRGEGGMTPAAVRGAPLSSPEGLTPAAVRGAPLSSEGRLASLQETLVEASRGASAADRFYEAGRTFERMAEAAVPAPRPRLTPQQIYKEIGPGVVLVVCGDEKEAKELGTGSIIDAEGLVLTNAHVVLDPSGEKPFDLIRVYLKPKRLTGDPEKDLEKPIEAKLLSFDKDLDLAVLKLAERPAAPAISIGDADAVEPGDTVIAIGHPEQGGLWTLTKGVISAVVADLGGVKGKDAFQTDASINRGNSGGPLLDEGGALIGVNTCMARKAADGLAITAVNFSVKADVVKGWLASAGAAVRYEAAPAVAVEEVKPEVKPEPKPVEAKPKSEPVTELKPLPEAPPARKEEPRATGAAAPEPQKPVEPQILTPVKPYSREDMLKAAMKDMEDLADEMRGMIEERRKR